MSTEARVPNNSVSFNFVFVVKDQMIIFTMYNIKTNIIPYLVL